MIKEICICAAIKMKDGLIIRGHRHPNCIKTAAMMPAYQDMLPVPIEEHGFITSRNRFVGRELALILQKEAGIESVGGGYRGDGLFSEDLY